MLRNGRAIVPRQLLLAAIALLVESADLVFSRRGSLVEACRPIPRPILPWVFIAPALVSCPSTSSIRLLSRDRQLPGQQGPLTLDNWEPRTGVPEMLRNNVIWLLVATSGAWPA